MEVHRLTEGERSEPEDPETQVFLCDKWLRTVDGDVELRSGKCKGSVLHDHTYSYITILLYTVFMFSLSPVIATLLLNSVFTEGRDGGEAEAAQTQTPAAAAGSLQVNLKGP